MKRNPIMYALALACLTSTVAASAAEDSMSSDRPAASSGDASTAASDSAITTKVKAALFVEPDLKSTGIKVETVKGVVQLSGFATSREEADRAAEVARTVEDVKSVENNINVR